MPTYQEAVLPKLRGALALSISAALLLSLAAAGLGRTSSTSAAGMVVGNGPFVVGANSVVWQSGNLDPAAPADVVAALRTAAPGFSVQAIFLLQAGAAMYHLPAFPQLGTLQHVPAVASLIVVLAASTAPTLPPATTTAGPSPTAAAPGGCARPSTAEVELARLINEYRAQNGLPAAPVSCSLTLVAETHVMDLQTNRPNTGTDNRGQACNDHSWSNTGAGRWTPVCYTSDHEYAEGMWGKPRELTGGAYRGDGYEIAFQVIGGRATPQAALDGWKRSPAHNQIVLEQGIWANKRWPAMGVGISENYAVVWFGDIADPLGSVP